MEEYIIENVSEQEWKKLEQHDIDWCPYDMDSTDVIIFGEEEYDRAVQLLGRDR